jgi:HlyD family secretion protein
MPAASSEIPWDERSESGNEPGDRPDESGASARLRRASIRSVEDREQLGGPAAFPVEHGAAAPGADDAPLKERGRLPSLGQVMKVLRAVVLLALLAGAGFAGWRYRATHQAPEVTYKTANAEKHRIVGKVTASGTLSALVTVLVGTQVSGRIQRLYADFNSKVTKGELVAKIDPQIFEATVAQAKANYAQATASVVNAQAQAKNADLQLARSRSLREQGLAAQQDLDTAEATAAMAHANVDMQQANLQQAAASLHQAQVNLSYTSILSPIDGVVISRSVDVGQTVAASLSAPTLFTIAQDLTKMQVDTNVAEGDVGRLQVGMATYFTVDSFPGQRFRGKIRDIRNAATTVQNVVTYDAVIDVDNTDLRLRPGMTANVTVIYAERQSVLSVPNAALRFHLAAPATPSGSAAGSAHVHGHKPAGGDEAPEARTLYVLRAGGEPQPVSVHTGLTDGTNTEVLDGDLKEGDPVVVDSVGGSSSTSAPPSSTQMRRLF